VSTHILSLGHSLPAKVLSCRASKSSSNPDTSKPHSFIRLRYRTNIPIAPVVISISTVAEGQTKKEQFRDPRQLFNKALSIEVHVKLPTPLSNLPDPPLAPPLAPPGSTVS
jgi:hypothetical protein